MAIRDEIISNWVTHFHNSKSVVDQRDIIFRVLPHLKQSENIDQKKLSDMNIALGNIKKAFIFNKDIESRVILMKPIIQLFTELTNNYKLPLKPNLS